MLETLWTDSKLVDRVEQTGNVKVVNRQFSLRL